MSEAPPTPAPPHRDTVRKLILMRETGPKSQAWHRARVQLIWRLHAEMERHNNDERGTRNEEC
jgi:hypothetical protein